MGGLKKISARSLRPCHSKDIHMKIAHAPNVISMSIEEYGMSGNDSKEIDYLDY